MIYISGGLIGMVRRNSRLLCMIICIYIIVGFTNGAQPSNATDKLDSNIVVSPADLTNLSLTNASVLNMITSAPYMAEAEVSEPTNITVAGMADAILEKTVSAAESKAISRQVSIKNKCCKDIWVLAMLQQPDGSWRSFGWFYLPQCGHYYLNSGGRLRTSNPNIYLYARANDWSATWTGSYWRYIWGSWYPMRLLTFNVDSFGDFDMTLWGCREDCRDPVQCQGESKLCHCGSISPD